MDFDRNYHSLGIFANLYRFFQSLSVGKAASLEQLSLARALEKEILSAKLTELLETFRTDELTMEEITEEVEAVRTMIYERNK
jgi:hypothetical protein